MIQGHHYSTDLSTASSALLCVLVISSGRLLCACRFLDSFFYHQAVGSVGKTCRKSVGNRRSNYKIKITLSHLKIWKKYNLYYLISIFAVRENRNGRIFVSKMIISPNKTQKGLAHLFLIKTKKIQ